MASRSFLLFLLSTLFLPSPVRASTSTSTRPRASGAKEAGPEDGSSGKGASVPEPRHRLRPRPFAQGRWRFALGGGGGLYGGRRYFSFLVGLGYFIIAGLELGLDVAHWFGSSPGITKVSPQVRYVFHQLTPLSPYVGAFYRHWFVWDGGSPAGLDTLGARLGLVYVLGRGYIGGGMAYEHIVNRCFTGCYGFYPELIAAITF